MKKRLGLSVVSVLILGLAMLALSCGGEPATPVEEPVVEEPAAEEPVVEETAAEEPAVEEPAAGPAAIPHPLEGRDDCLMCHAEGIAGAPKVPADHAERGNDICAGCHQPEAG